MATTSSRSVTGAGTLYDFLHAEASGAGGGLLCVYDTAGRAHFREHTDEEKLLAFAELPSEASAPARPGPPPGSEPFQLRLDVLPENAVLPQSAQDGAASVRRSENAAGPSVVRGDPDARFELRPDARSPDVSRPPGPVSPTFVTTNLSDHRRRAVCELP